MVQGRKILSTVFETLCNVDIISRVKIIFQKKGKGEFREQIQTIFSGSHAIQQNEQMRQLLGEKVEDSRGKNVHFI